jgi:hypothetical protein
LFALNEILRNFNNRFGMMSEYRVDSDLWGEFQLNVEKLFAHFVLGFPLGFDESGQSFDFAFFRIGKNLHVFNDFY